MCDKNEGRPSGVEHRRFPLFGQRDTLVSMFHSRSFMAHAQKTRKHHRDDPDAIERDLEAYFIRQVPQVGNELAADLFAHIWQSRSDFTDRTQSLGDILDLLFQQYDDETDPLTQEDWEVLRDSIDQHALDLDMSLVQYVMERVVAHHAI